MVVDILNIKCHNHKGEIKKTERMKNEIESLTEIKIERHRESKRKEEIATWKTKRK